MPSYASILGFRKATAPTDVGRTKIEMATPGYGLRFCGPRPGGWSTSGLAAAFSRGVRRDRLCGFCDEVVYPASYFAAYRQLVGSLSTPIYPRLSRSGLKLIRDVSIRRSKKKGGVSR
jgi:hypothetical protein